MESKSIKESCSEQNSSGTKPPFVLCLPVTSSRSTAFKASARIVSQDYNRLIPPEHGDDAGSIALYLDPRYEYTTALPSSTNATQLTPYLPVHLATAQQEEQEEPESRPPSNYDQIVITHATLMGLAFVLLMPLGVFIMRLLSSKNTVWYHASMQLLAYTIALAAFGLGAWMATVSGAWTASNGHPILGTIIIALLLLQPALGYVHHRIYVQQKARTAWGVAHVWYGRVLILLAVINGGLGLQLSGNTVKGEIAYGVIAGVMFLLYLAVLGVAYLRKDNKGETIGEKGIGSPKTKSGDGEVDGHGSAAS
ncbi:MAG: hypothetical protein Q9168_002344 [Polycauliona sp. 1 TL-2023]